ncbi:MAG: CDP-glycerol glycerophosphotransferase family protein [Candidatus Yanofskybacteria bacterium]|nr:CDP-glycerol glycerophosphotransferase family protein [Candidatus Yanofskybacteria bacterium]
MKTIFISSFHPLISRNILSTEILPRLLEKGIRVVLPTPRYKKEYFNENFGVLPGVVVEGVDYNRPSGTLTGRLLKRIFHALLTAKNVEIYYRRRVVPGKSTPYRIAFRAINVMGRFQAVKNIARLIFSVTSPGGFFLDLLDQYHPDLVVVTDLHNENDVALMQDARRRSIPIVGIVRSWDHLTSKGLLKIVPDFICTPNEFLKYDAQTLHGVPEEKIKIVGIPHYDQYFSHLSSSREKFTERLGVDPKTRFVLYAPFGSRYTPGNSVDRDVIDCISQALPSAHKLIVRFPPTDSVDLDGFVVPQNVILDRPGVHLSSRPEKFIRNELTREDDEWLQDTLSFSDVVISGLSTMSIDGAIFDKPVIVVGFDGYSQQPHDQSVRRYFEYDYFQPLFRSGGVRLAESVDDFRSFLAVYLADPKKDADGRRRLVQEQCGFTDGKSSERVCNVIFDILGIKNFVSDKL